MPKKQSARGARSGARPTPRKSTAGAGRGARKDSGPGAKGGPAGTRQRLRVAVDDAHLEHIPDVVKRLKASGMTIGDVMNKLGAITGSADPSALEAIRKVKGISHVEPQREYGVAPPESDVQ